MRIEQQGKDHDAANADLILRFQTTYDEALQALTAFLEQARSGAIDNNQQHHEAIRANR